MSGDVSVSINLGHVLMGLLGALMWIIWNNLNGKFEAIQLSMRERDAALVDRIVQGDRASEDNSRERYKRIEDRVVTIDNAINQLPSKIEALGQEIKRLEIIMAEHYGAKVVPQRRS